MATEVQTYLADTGQSDWDIIPLRWESLAVFSWPLGDFANEKLAVVNNVVRYNGILVGFCLGQALEGMGYEYVHMIGHSAGASLVDSASRLLKENKGKPVTVQLTFLDAYTPDNVWKANPAPSAFVFGASADFTEHYVRRDYDERNGTLFNSLLGGRWLNAALSANLPARFFRDTDKAIAGACNYDISSVATPQEVLTVHGGPIAYYRNTVVNKPIGGSAGFGTSREVRANGWTASACPGEKGEMIDVTNLTIVLPPGIDLTKDFPPLGSDLFKKSTGTGTFTPGSGSKWSQKTSSPVEVAGQVEVPGGLAFLQFTFRFLGSSQGYLTVTLDGVPIYGAPEEAVAGETVDTGMVALPPGTAPGTHTLAFHLERLGSSASELEVSDVHFGILLEAAADTSPSPTVTAPRPPNAGNGMASAASDSSTEPLAAVAFVVALLAGAVLFRRSRRTI